MNNMMLMVFITPIVENQLERKTGNEMNSGMREWWVKILLIYSIMQQFNGPLEFPQAPWVHGGAWGS